MEDIMKKIIYILVLMFATVLYGCQSKIYTVEFVVNGEVVSTQEIAAGNPAIAPEDPVLEGYTFNGWDKDFSKVNVAYPAKFSKFCHG
jgi:hypothetical protein